MFNLNLLPKKEKQNISWEKRNSQTLYLGSFIIVSVFIFLILLFPSYIFLALQNDDITRNLELEEQSQKALQTKMIENRLIAININIQQILQNNAQLFMPGNFVEHLIQLAEGRVLLTQIQYHQKNKEVRITGWAETRDNFLDFKNTLEAQGGVSDIVSPISNVIKEKNVRFMVNATVKNP